MKKYLILILSTAVCIALVFTFATVFAPQAVQVSLYTVTASEMENSITCSGTIEETRKKDVYLSTPVIASDIVVSIGDVVEQGQTLFYVDKASTVSALSSGSGNSLGLSQEVLNNLDSSTASSILGNNATDTSNSMISADDIPSVVEAPISGTVTSINVTESGISTAGAAVVTISDLESLQVKININESKISEVSVGQQVSITGTAFKDRTYTGTIEKIYPAARQQLNGVTYETVVDAVVTIDNVDDALKPNCSAEVSIITSHLSDAIVIPYEMVRQDENGQEYVYVYSMSQAHRVEIQTGEELSNGVEVLSGLKANDRIITNPDDITGHGVRVKLADEVEINA